MKKFSLTIAAFAAFFLASAPARAQSMETEAQYAFMIDYDTGTVLFNKGGDEKMHPSSMTKLMTSYILEKRVQEGKIKLTDTLPVSEKAWKMQGSKMFVHVGDQVKVEDLIRGIIIQSGNDACIVVAEGLSGSEEAFAQEMNATARELGMTNTNFMNSTGWPDEAHVMSPRDLVTLATHVIRDFPDSYHYYAETSFTYNNITQANRNLLLGNEIGVDGLKTGHTEAGGYGITLSAKDPHTARRVVLVVNGLASDSARIREGDRLLRWGLRAFTNYNVAKAGEVIDRAEVWQGTAESVPLVVEKDIVVTLPNAATGGASFSLRYASPLAAPVAKGAHVADLIIRAPGQEEQTIPVVAAESVDRLGLFGRAWANLRHLVSQKLMGSAEPARQ